MPLFFKEVSSLKQKVGVSLFCAIIGFSFFPIFSRVLVNDNVIVTFSVLAIIVYILTVIYFFIVLLNKTSKFHKNIEAQGKKPSLLLLGICFLSPLILYMSISVGLPSALHMLVSEPGQLVVTVKSKRSVRYCRNGMYINEHKYFLNNEVCRINKADWESLASGDKISLLGRKSYFGFSYDQYKILTNKAKKK
ncbi:MAG: hypothetical protein KKC46_01010 [Proteobacteria bacterium]|nr:hypothetical protein [Pseudomonadota bacterium]